ncbi:MAG: folate-binding protein [Pseudomonadota bacterium]|nr:folate-binding protein [Pseudomonadota bacterium]
MPCFFTELPDRAMIRVTGADRKSFLGGLLTNDVAGLAEGQVLYAALLTPQGRFLHDMLVLDQGETLLLDTEAGRCADLIRRLSLYKLRADVQFRDETTQWAVLALWGDCPPVPSALADPRHPDLGWRLYVSRADQVPAGMQRGTFDDYNRHRIQLAIPDGSRDMTPEKSFIMDFGLDALNGISFTKGCYVGQELTARMKHRDLTKRRLVSVRVDSPLPVRGTEIFQDGKPVGEILSSCGDLALALVLRDTPPGPMVMAKGKTVRV